MRVVVINHLTLDGVMQAPGRPEEDIRGGFERGGWANSTLLHGDVGEAVAQLKRPPGKDLNGMGSGELIQTLMRHDLIDEYLLLVHPLVLGAGRRLFADGGSPASLRLVDSTVSGTGVLITTHQPERLE